jgi:hypothetical protein
VAVEEIMKLKNLAVSSATALALVSGAEKAAADPGMQCEIHYRHLIRVALSVAIGESPVHTFAIARVVDQLWEPEGVDIEWIDETKAATEDRLDAWVVVGRTVAESANVPPLQMQLPRESTRHLLFGGPMMDRALGYAVAHRLGHAVLGLSHAPAGLMSASDSAAPGLAAVLTGDLDAANRRLLQTRFGVGCAAR